MEPGCIFLSCFYDTIGKEKTKSGIKFYCHFPFLSLGQISSANSVSSPIDSVACLVYLKYSSKDSSLYFLRHLHIMFVHVLAINCKYTAILFWILGVGF